MARILIIEDNEANLELMKYLLEAAGHTIVVARDGEAGLREAEAAPFDLILCDIALPRIAGDEVARHIKADARLRDIPMIAVTAFAMVGDRENVMSAGFDGYITKPISPEAFASQVAAFMRGRGAKILVVDDDATNRDVLRSILEPHGYRMTEAADGAEALSIAQLLRPDLVVTDIIMPTMDGYELVRRLRSTAGIGATRVVFYTAHYHRAEAQELAAALGVVEILHKPVEPEQVLEIIERTLGRPPESARPLDGEVAQRHVRVITDKLAETVEHLRIANDRLQALIEMSLEFASEREPQPLLERFCRHARELLAARYGVVAVARRGENTTAFSATAGLDASHAAAAATPALAAPIAVRALERRESYTLSASATPADLGLPQHYPPFRNGVVAPVVSLSDVYGWIVLTDKVGAEEFSAEDVRLLGILAAEAGRIYENASLYSEVVAKSEQLTTRMAQLAAADEKVRRLNRVYVLLSGVNNLIVRVRDRAVLFYEACRIAVEDGGFAIAWVGLADAQHANVVPAAWAGERAAEYLQASEPYTEPQPPGITGRALRERRATFINDLAAEPPETLGPRRREALRRGCRSMFACPLIVFGEVIGTFTLLAHEPNFFDAEESRLLEELAGDISFALEHLANEAKLQYLAFFDSLTTLPNRTLFEDRLKHALGSVEEQNARLALVLCDIKRFHYVNESLGRQAGDELLRLVAQRLRTACANAGNVGRISADVFAGFLTSVRSAADVAHAIERLRSAFSKPFAVAGQSISIDLTAGIALAPSDGTDADTVFRNAEAALKQAKLSGEPYLFYQRAMNASVAETLLLENRLRRAIEHEHFVLHYQPKFDLTAGRISGLEALMRWNDAERGLVPPAKFIPLLEDTGLILAAGQWAISRALNDYREWSDEGLNPPRVAVNVSALQLRQKDFVETVTRSVRDCRVDATALDLELTESLVMGDIATSMQKLKSVRDTGIQVSVDDFGTGYSSLTYLAKLPVNTLKIDRSFVMTMTSSPESMAIVSTILSLARSLRLNVVAEGVETEEQARLLKLLRCDEAQGYLFSKPIPAADIRSMLATPPTIH